MPIEVFTGTPGAGKTLRMLQEVQERAKRENRSVYYNGINGLSPDLGWIEFDNPEDWYKLPNGSIIVLDEAQRVFRPSHFAKEVPPYLAELETHRHKGLDIYLTTQRIMLLHSNLRGLIGRHVHVARRFGMQRAVLLEFPRAVERPEGKQADAVRHEWSYPKEVFQWYKSAELHTIKRRIPAKVWVLLAVPVLIAAAVYVFTTRQAARIRGDLSTGTSVPAGVLGSTPSVPRDRQKKTTTEYLADYMPRVAGFAHTAPVYDKVTEPVRAPFPAACVHMGSDCKCYTDQATVLDVPAATCLKIVRKGFYVDWETAPRREQGDGRDLVSAGREKPPVGLSSGSSPVMMADAVPVSSLSSSVPEPVGRGHWLDRPGGFKSAP